MAFSEQQKIEELQRLRDFLDEVEIAAEVLPKGTFGDEIVMVVALPTHDEEFNAEEFSPDQIDAASIMMLDLDDNEKRLAKYLLIYTQIDVDLSKMTVAEAILLLNDLNRTVRIGHYFLAEKEEGGPQVVHYRATVAGVEEEPFDEGIVADAILEMAIGYDYAKHAFRLVNEELKNRG